MPAPEALKPASEAADGYGADRNGIVWAYAFEPGQSSRPVPAETLRDRLATIGQDGPFLWLHFVTSASSERWMRANLDLPESFYEGLHGDTASTRLEQQDLSLVSVLHDVLFGFAFDPADISTVILCITPHLVVSARLKPLRSVDRLREAVRAGHPFGSSAGLLSHLLRDQAGVLADIVRRSTARVDGIEDQLLGNRIAASRREMGALRRIPLASHRHGFVLIVAGLLAFTAALAWVFTRRFRPSPAG